MTSYGGLVALRRPGAGYADAPTTFVTPAVLLNTTSVQARPASGWTWDRQAFALDWTVVDRLLLPLALWLAGGWPAGTHRRHRGDIRRRGITLRRPTTRTRTTRTGGTR